MIIKNANTNDIQDILDCLKGLAIHEGRPKAFSTTKEKLKHNLFTDNNIILKAIIDNKIIGIAILYKTFLTYSGGKGLFLETLYIHSEFRSKGHGTSLIKYVVDFAKKNNFLRIEWKAVDTNKRAIAFYQDKLHAKIPPNKVYFRLTKKEMELFD